ncbi:MAG TPA: hypothetical protein ENI20_01585, partial [Bacteroides sp.]|nr:hypothetical protein [Bacteroides sp.]
ADTYGLAFLKSQEATSTSLPLEENGIECESVKKVHEGRPNIVDAIKNGVITLVVNTSAALAATKGIKDRRNGAYKVKSLQEYHLSLGK